LRKSHSTIVCATICVCWQRYRLIRKYIRHPRLMKLEWINQYGKYLLSEVVSNTLVYFVNLLHSGPKSPIEFVVIDIPWNLLQVLGELILLTYLNHFEFSFTIENK
jgi:hypothetical protein